MGSAAPPQTPLHPALQRGLAQGKTIFVLQSDEELLQLEMADAVRAAARTHGYTERQVFTVSGAHFKWEPVLTAGAALSLFADKTLLEVRIPSGKPGGKDGAAALEQLAKQTAAHDGVLLLVTLPKLDKAGKSSAWFTALQGAGVAIEIAQIERAQLPAWIAQRLALQGQHVADTAEGEHALHWMAERVEGNLLAAHQEISKLAMLYPPGELGFEHIRASVAQVARYNPDQLSEAAFAGQVLRAQQVLAGLLAEGEAEVKLHWGVAEDVRNLHRVRCALDSGQPLPVALAAARVWGSKQRMIERLAPRLTQQQTAQLLHSAQVADGIVKGLSSPGWLKDGSSALARLVHEISATSLQARKVVRA